MPIHTESPSELKQLDTSSLPAGQADALAQRQNLHLRAVSACESASTLEKGAVLLEGSALGLVNHGLDQLINHPGQFAGEIVGAGALSLAMRGPAWVKLPAAAIAAVGTASFGMHAAEAGAKTYDALHGLNHSNFEATRQTVAAQMGPLLFDTLAMGATAKLAATPGLLPEKVSGEAISRSLKGSLDKLFPEGELATPSGLRLKAGDSKTDHIMAMAIHRSPEGINIHRGLGPRNERIQLVEFLKPGETVHFQHPDLSLTRVSADGKVMAGFASGEARLVDIGGPIKRIHISEYAGGFKQIRLNDSIQPNIEISSQNHTVKAAQVSGDHVHLVDNIPGGYMKFDHKDGLQSWIEYSGRMVFKLPNGKMSEKTLPSQLANIKLTEKVDGSKTFQFTDSQGRVVAQKVELPPTPQIKQFEDLPLWRQTAPRPQQQPIAGSGAEALRYEPSAGGTLSYGKERRDNVAAPWDTRLRPIPMQRAFAEHLAGVDRRVMRNDDLSSPASMGLAQQGHGWVVTRYLQGLNRQDKMFFDD